MAEKVAAITTLTDAFCAAYLDDEYRQMVAEVLAALARKRPSPLLSGKENVWAAGAVHALGYVNFLSDPAHLPHCKPKQIVDYFGIGESSGQAKSKTIRALLGMEQLSPKWTVPSMLAHNPMVWMLEVNGMLIDVRHAPLALQRQAFEMGLIPFVPAVPAEQQQGQP